MAQLISSASPVTSYVVYMNGASKPSFQLAVEGSGAVSAQVQMEGSHDGKGWIPIATLSASGNAYATDGGPVETNWPLMRGRLTAVSGGTANLYFAL